MKPSERAKHLFEKGHSVNQVRDRLLKEFTDRKKKEVSK